MTWPVLLRFLVVPLPALLSVACLSISSDRTRPEKSPRKTWSGFDWSAETTIETTPSPSRQTDGFDQERVWPGGDDWEPAVAADRFSPWVYQATTRYSGNVGCAKCPDVTISFRASSDGGETFHFERDFPYGAGLPGQYDPELAVSNDGTIFAAWLHDFVPGVVFSKSTDHGVNWTSPRAVKGSLPWNDKPAIAVSGDGRDVYVGFNVSDAYIAASHDGGQTFAEPVRTNQDTRYWFHYQGAVLGNFVWFATTDYGPDYQGETHASVVWSSDRGSTWTSTRLGTSAEPPGCSFAPGCYFGFLGPAAGIAADSSGAVAFAYNASLEDGQPPRLFVRVSHDGVSWGAAQAIGDPSPEVGNGFPAVAAGSRPGDFRVVWQDYRLEPQARFATRLRATRDFGKSWSEIVRLSDRLDGAPYKTPEGYAFPYGDYLCVTVGSDDVTHAIWGEGSSYNGPGGTWSTRGQLPPGRQEHESSIEPRQR